MQPKALFSVFLCWLLLSPPCFAVAKNNFRQTDALQAANILGVRSQVDRLLALKNSGQDSVEEVVLLKTSILRKILRAVLEVRQACNKLDLERAYTYDIMQKEQRREYLAAQLFNLANFAQLSTFYTLEPYVRLDKQFVTSAIFTTISGSLNTGISTLSRIHGALAKADHVAPPERMANLIEGGPIDTTGMPPLVTKYLDSPAPNSSKSRRDELFSAWMRNYHIDASKKENLCSLADRKKASVKLLQTRILLLWSLHTYVQNFDRELLALLKLVGNPVTQGFSEKLDLSASQYTPGSIEVARLLKIESFVEELSSLKRTGADPARTCQLELFVLEKSLEGALEVQVASDKVDEDLYYNYHVILSNLLQTRSKWLQYNYDANFLQSGILGIVAGRLYLSRKSFQGDQKFVISGSNGVGLTTLAMLQMHGFWRKVDTGPNSLGEILNLHPADEYRFSPFVSSILNSVPPGSTDGRTRRELLNDVWKQSHVTTMNLKSEKNLKAVASMPSHKYDTIKVVKNRITLLHSLKKDLESFQTAVLELLHGTQGEPQNDQLGSGNVTAAGKLTSHAREAAKLLGIEDRVDRLLALKENGKFDNYDQESVKLQLALIRTITSAGLELRKVSAKFDREIVIERQALDKLTSQRDTAVALTNDANFLQLGILSIIIDGPLEETKNPNKILAGNRLNIVSGLTVGGLALLALCEQRGGIRRSKAEANLLGQTLGLDSPETVRLPPMLWTYLNSIPPNSNSGLTRREQLIEYWKTAKILPINIKKQGTAEKVSAFGPQHRQRCETIKLLTARITMLFDLRAMIDLLNTGLVELLQALD